ncbi:hypothetical protein BHM03_00026273, partial [Ensete ventricosum]
TLTLFASFQLVAAAVALVQRWCRAPLVAALPTSGTSWVGGCHAHSQCLCAPPLYELATGAAPMVWLLASIAPYGLTVGDYPCGLDTCGHPYIGPGHN